MPYIIFISYLGRVMRYLMVVDNSCRFSSLSLGWSGKVIIMHPSPSLPPVITTHVCHTNKDITCRQMHGSNQTPLSVGRRLTVYRKWFRLWTEQLQASLHKKQLSFFLVVTYRSQYEHHLLYARTRTPKLHYLYAVTLMSLIYVHIG